MASEFGEKWKRRSSVPIHALFDLDGKPTKHAKKMIGDAEVIAFFDVMTGKQLLVYGLDLYKEVVQTGTSKEMRGLPLVVSLDRDADELEKLLALVRQVKGKDDYEEAQIPAVELMKKWGR